MQRMTHTIVSVYCMFCGRPLGQGSRPDQWVCAGCRAVFTAERNERGCIVSLRVADCGAGAECCQSRIDAAQ